VDEFVTWDKFAIWANCGVDELWCGRIAVWANFNSPLRHTQTPSYHAHNVFFCVFTWFICIFANVLITHV